MCLNIEQLLGRIRDVKYVDYNRKIAVTCFHVSSFQNTRRVQFTILEPCAIELISDIQMSMLLMKILFVTELFLFIWYKCECQLSGTDDM